MGAKRAQEIIVGRTFRTNTKQESSNQNSVDGVGKRGLKEISRIATDSICPYVMMH